MAESKQAKPSAGPAAVGASLRKRFVVALVGIVAAGSAAGGYFALHPAAAGAETVGLPSAEIPFPMPAAVAALAPRIAPSDYQIVSVFGAEAILAAGSTLLRVKVGSQAPSLGTITAIVPMANGGGSVVGTEATLRTL